ncbi:hypothetical protein DQ04_03471040 [Trypanosoma grayi]|uniref:hypothetical protein n=1 Tax=Trypanosoma grayi TaxID=71804 RepID=UPI0004F426CB|nr:hypothetical protein DQ04_03471040 [Trypanosoma grayi]KEG10644.1 hypothetical protein DQ04_03471040 [Trypanosoma grayi]
MACVSQSITRYPLLRCIVSAAEFARGELCFYESYAELVAQDAAGETTTPLRIDYDLLLHFRVVRQQQLMRIELPRSIVLRWAEANSFAAELDAGEDVPAGDADRPCALIEQLCEEDMAHFLQCVAPMVAASRRARSASRLSATEPLPLSYYPPNPAAAAVAGEEDAEDEAVAGDKTYDDDDDDDAAGDVDAAVTDGCASRQSRSAASTAASDGDSSPMEGKESHRRASASSSSSSSSSSQTGDVPAGKPQQQAEEEDEEKECLSRCLEVLGAAIDSPGVHLTRGSSTQESGVLARVVARRPNSRGAAASGGSSDVAKSIASLPVGATRTKQKAAPRRRPPHVVDDEEMRGCRPAKRARRDVSSPPSPPAESQLAGEVLGGAAAAAEARAAGEAQFSAATATTPLHKSAPHSESKDFPEQTVSPPFPPHRVAAAQPSAVAVYNFADVVTAPEDAAQLPIAPAVKKLLVDLQEILPPKRRRTAGGAKSRCLPAKKAPQQQRKPATKKRGAGGGTVPLRQFAAGAAAAARTQLPAEATAAVPKTTSSPPPLLLSRPSTGGSEKVIPLPSAAANAATTTTASTRSATPLLDSRVLRESHKASPTAPPSSHQEPQQPPPPPIELVNAAQPASVPPPSAPSPCLSLRSDYRLAEKGLHNNRDENDVGAAVQYESSVHTPAAAVVTPPNRKLAHAWQNTKSQLQPTPLRAHTPLPTACASPSSSSCHQRHARECGVFHVPPSEDCRTNRWRRVVRQLNSLSVHLTRARACGEELRGLFLVMLEDAEV